LPIVEVNVQFPLQLDHKDFYRERYRESCFRSLVFDREDRDESIILVADVFLFPSLLLMPSLAEFPFSLTHSLLSSDFSCEISDRSWRGWKKMERRRVENDRSGVV